MRKSGEPMEFGIFDYSEVFSRAFAEGGEWGSGDLEWMVGDVAPAFPPSNEFGGILGDLMASIS